MAEFSHIDDKGDVVAGGGGGPGRLEVFGV